MESTAPPPLARPSTWICVFLLAVLGAAIEWWLGLALRPELEQHRDSFRLTRPEDDPVEVRPDKVVELPYPFADGDVLADIEMGEGTGLDVLLRRVEPRYEDGAMVPFHGRFAVLRLSADESRTDASPYRTREQALFEGEDPFAIDGGALPMDGGYRVTLEIQMRGRNVRARVAGRPWTEWFEATDEHGGLAFFARRGKTIVHRFQFDPILRDGIDLPWVGLALGLVVGFGVVLIGGLAAGVGCALGSGLLAAGLGTWFESLLVPLCRTEPSTVSLLAAAALLAGAGVGLLLRPRRGWWGLPLGLAGALVCIEGALRIEAPRLRAFEDPRLELFFGVDSGIMPADALAQRVTPMFGAIRMVGEDFRRVFLLGGTLIWENADAAHSLAPLLLGGLRARLGRDIDVVAPVGSPGDLLQAVRRFERFGAGFEPALVAVAPNPYEFESVDGGRVRARWEAAAPWEPSALRLLEVLAGDPPRGPAATEGDLALALDELADWSARSGTPWLAVAVPELPDAIRDLLRAAAERHGAPFVALTAADPAENAAALAEAIASRLGGG